MLMQWDTLKGFPVAQPRKPEIDDDFDSFNRKFVFSVLLLFGSIITLTQAVGPVVKCHGFTKFVLKDNDYAFVEAFCWTQGLYTVAEAYHSEKVPYPGVIPYEVPPCLENKLYTGGRNKCPNMSDVKPFTKISHLWYQWIPFYFLLCAVTFHAPHVLCCWGGFRRLKPILNRLNSIPPNPEDEVYKKVVSSTAGWIYINYMVTHKYLLPTHRKCKAGGFLIGHTLGVLQLVVKLLYLCFSVGVFLMTSRVFSFGSFLTYGPDWLDTLHMDGHRASTLVRDKLFPKMVSCELKRWGLTGLEKEAGMCVLAPNVVNQYLFLFLWFLYVFTICINVLSCAYGVATFNTAVGYRLFLKGSLVSRKPDCHEAIRRMYCGAGMSARAIMHVISRNIDAGMFEDILIRLAGEYEQEDKLNVAAIVPTVPGPAPPARPHPSQGLGRSQGACGGHKGSLDVCNPVKPDVDLPSVPSAPAPDECVLAAPLRLGALTPVAPSPSVGAAPTYAPQAAAFYRKNSYQDEHSKRNASFPGEDSVFDTDPKHINVNDPDHHV